MKQKISLSKAFITVCVISIVIGLAAFIYGFISDPQRTWANFLLNNFYFLSLGIGGAFFLTLQAITRSGWSAGFRRVPEAMMMYIPVAGILFLFIILGMHHLYPWTNHELVEESKIVEGKTAFLNVPFFYLRLVLSFAIWIFMIFLIRKISLKEDNKDGSESYKKIEKLSRIFIFVLAITFSVLAFDLLMSIDVEWFSTIFAFKYFIAAFLHGSAIIFLIVFVLNKRGYFEFLNVSHTHDFARYIFIVSIFYGYFWFSQFMIIWYGNMPEETIYYAQRWLPEWKLYWLFDIILNWAVPFFVLLPVMTSRNKNIVMIVALILIIGQWVDLYVTIFPGAVGKNHLGFIEIGSFIGFAGLFSMVTGYFLSKAKVVPENNPYIKESYQHSFESYI